MEELNDAGIEMVTGNIILVMLQHFIGTFEGCREFRGQEIFLGTTDIEENKVTRLIDVLGGRVGRGDALEFVGVSTFLGSRAQRLEVIVQELNIFILTGELVGDFRQVHVNMVKVNEGKMVRTLGGLRVDVAIDDI